MEVFNPIPAWILDWMERSWINAFMLDYSYTWVTFETLHFVGMCMLFGSIIVMDLSLLGFDRPRLSAHAVHALIPLALSGFAINLITGIFFCFGNPYRYAVNVSFQLKMVLVVLAGINALWFWRTMAQIPHAADASEIHPLRARVIGLTSLLLWTGVLSFGRLIPYLGTG